MPPPGSTVGLPREVPDNGELFESWPAAATILDAEHFVPVLVRLRFGDAEQRVGALAVGWAGDRVAVSVPTRWRIWLPAADVERERFL